MNEQPLDSIITKIEGLLRKANHPNTTQPEKEAFQAKALQLMDKHRIDNVAWDVDPNEQPGTECYGLIKGSYAMAIQTIVSAVARLYGCKIYYTGVGRPGDPARTVFVVGFKADRARVMALAELFVQDAQRQAAKHKTDSPNLTIAYRKSFLVGYATEIMERYRVAKAAEVKTAAIASAELVLVSRAEQVQSKMKTMGLVRGSGVKTSSLNTAGYAAGKEAGRNSNIGRAGVGGGVKGALGA